ncbi:MAG: hypothetical protein V3T72_05540 [Thermoanaerobaculia bacterium]
MSRLRSAVVDQVPGVTGLCLALACGMAAATLVSFLAVRPLVAGGG